MRSLLFCCLLLGTLLALPGCHDELAQAETWDDSQTASYVGAGAFLEEEAETPVQQVSYQRVCKDGVCSLVPVPDPVSTPKSVVVRSSSSYRVTPLRSFGSRVRGFFSRIRSHFGRGC